MKIICLSTDLRAQIRTHCVASYPHEACGLLLGGGGRVTRIVRSRNLSAQPERKFEIDPALIIHHQKASRDQKTNRDQINSQDQKYDPDQKEGGVGPDKVLGHYHSHPDGLAAPSIHDQAQNYDTSLIWVIVQITDGVAVDMKAFATEPETGRLKAILLNP